MTNENSILDYLKRKEAHLNELTRELGMDRVVVLRSLLKLERKGRVCSVVVYQKEICGEPMRWTRIYRVC